MLNDNKLTLGLLAVLGLLSPVSAAHGARIYSFAVGHDYGSHDYIDAKGNLNGFGPGLIDIVCGAAKIDCRIMLDPYTNCWYSEPGQHSTGGVGLMDQWFDGCTGWYATVERSHVFQFSLPYLKKTTTHFFILPGKVFETSKSNIQNSKIVFLDGWASDEKCMVRETGAKNYPPNIFYAKSAEEAISLLNNGYDAIFTTFNTFKAESTDGTLKIVGPEYSCIMDGNGIMTRKDNDLLGHWNQGFTKLKNDGGFKEFCKAANAEHIAQGSLECIDD